MPANAGIMGSIPGLGGSPGGRNGNPLQCPCLENPIDRGAWWATVHSVAKESRHNWRKSTYVQQPIPILLSLRKLLGDWVWIKTTEDLTMGSLPYLSYSQSPTVTRKYVRCHANKWNPRIAMVWERKTNSYLEYICYCVKHNQVVIKCQLGLFKVL